MVSQGEFRYGVESRGSAVMSSQGAARCASDWRVLAVGVRHVIVRPSKARQGLFRLGSHVMAKLVKFGLGVECYGSLGL